MGNPRIMLASGIARSRHMSQVIRNLSPTQHFAFFYVGFSLRTYSLSSGKMTPQELHPDHLLLKRAHLPFILRKWSGLSLMGLIGLFPQPWSWEGEVSHTGTPWNESASRKVSQRKWRCWYPKWEWQNSSQWKIEIYTLWSKLRRLMWKTKQQNKTPTDFLVWPQAGNWCLIQLWRTHDLFGN